MSRGWRANRARFGAPNACKAAANRLISAGWLFLHSGKASRPGTMARPGSSEADGITHEATTMKVSFYARMTYVTSQELPEGWPLAPTYYDAEATMHSYNLGIEQARLADELGFDWVSFSEHHYSNGWLSPNPEVMAAALV